MNMRNLKEYGGIMNMRNLIVWSLLIASVGTCTFVCNARWIDQPYSGTNRVSRDLPVKSLTTNPQWQNDRYNDRSWYDIKRAPSGDEYSDNLCSGPNCGPSRQW